MKTWLIAGASSGTNFGAVLDRAEPTDVYERTPAGEVHRAISSGEFVIRGDAANTVDASIATADGAHPPFRLVLGSTAKRLHSLEPLRDVAFSADRKNELTRTGARHAQ